jgi:serine protease AprX
MKISAISIIWLRISSVCQSAVWDGGLGRRWKLSLALSTLVIMLPAAFGKNLKISKDLDTTKDKTVDVIVQYRATPTGANREKAAKKGGALKAELKAARADVYSVPTSALDDLAADSDVKYISPDREVKASDIYINDASGAVAAQSYGWKGTGVGVAVIDSGVSLAPDFDKQVVYSQSFVSVSSDEKYGHGTHVAGIIAGIGKDSGGTYIGVAPGAKIVSFRVLTDLGVGTDSAVISAIDRAIELKSKYNIRVINLSLGRAVYESYTLDPLCQAVERAWKADIVVVAAAGNFGRFSPTNGYATIGSPGIDPFIITVGAMKSMSTMGRGDDQITSYSSKLRVPR